MKKKVTMNHFNVETMKLEIQIREIEIDYTFQAYNLLAHQCLDPVNIETMKDYVKEYMTNGFEKDQVIDFLNRLEKQSHKLDYALKTIEDDIAVGQTIEIG